MHVQLHATGAMHRNALRDSQCKQADLVFIVFSKTNKQPSGANSATVSEAKSGTSRCRRLISNSELLNFVCEVQFVFGVAIKFCGGAERASHINEVTCHCYQLLLRVLVHVPNFAFVFLSSSSSS
jgi:hypothetical protein